MDLVEAKKQVYESGLRLLDEGLVARSWGNISVRVDKDTMVITPSGIGYKELAPKLIVVVNLPDLRYSGKLKPSSEVGLHARIYRSRPDTNAIIHTHQPQASVVAAARREITLLNEDMKKFIGASIRCAGYPLPSSKRLIEATYAALSDRKAVLMANHGALCVGNDLNDAFIVAKKLEEICQAFVEYEFLRFTCEESFDVKVMHGYFLKEGRGS